MSYQTKLNVSVTLRALQLAVSITCVGLAAWILSMYFYYDANGWMVGIAGISTIYLILTLVWSSCPPSLVSAAELFQTVVWIAQTIYRGVLGKEACDGFKKHVSGYYLQPFRNSDDYPVAPVGYKLCRINWALVGLGAFASLLFLISYVTHLIKVWRPVTKHTGFGSTFKTKPQVRGLLFLNELFVSRETSYTDEEVTMKTSEGRPNNV